MFYRPKEKTRAVMLARPVYVPRYVSQKHSLVCGVNVGAYDSFRREALVLSGLCLPFITESPSRVLEYAQQNAAFIKIISHLAVFLGFHTSKPQGFSFLYEHWCVPVEKVLPILTTKFNRTKGVYAFDEPDKLNVSRSITPYRIAHEVPDTVLLVNEIGDKEIDWATAQSTYRNVLDTIPEIKHYSHFFIES